MKRSFLPSFQTEIASLETNLNAAVARLKTAEPLDASAITSLVDGLWHRVDGQLASVKTVVENEKRRKKKEEEGMKKKREAEEREKLRRVEEEMESQKKRREEEDRNK